MPPPTLGEPRGEVRQAAEGRDAMTACAQVALTRAWCSSSPRPASGGIRFGVLAPRLPEEGLPPRGHLFMLDIPGFRILGTLRATGSNMLFHAVREADGVPVILKTPMSPSPGSRENERYRREFVLLRRLQDVRGVARAYSCERIHERPVLLLERVQGEPLS